MSGSSTIELRIPGLEDPVEIGSGGFGVVYRVRQPAVHRTVAVKLLRTATRDEKVRMRFEREVAAMGALSGHPSIVTVFDSGTTGDGAPYIVMELLEGSMGDRLDAEGPLPWEDLLEVLVRVAGGLETAHVAGILHRDIKPENILVSSYGEPKLGDFGIARLKGGPETRTDSLTASVAHVAPELLGGSPPSVATDVYALGSTIYTMLAGGPAFLRDTDESILPALARIGSDPVPDLRARGVPGPVSELVERLMCKAPEDRPGSALAVGELAQEVQRAHGLPVTPLAVRREEARALRRAVREGSDSDRLHTGSAAPSGDTATVGGPDLAAAAAAAAPAGPSSPAPPPAAPVTGASEPSTGSTPPRGDRPGVASGPLSRPEWDTDDDGGPPPPAKRRAPLVAAGAVGVVALAAVGALVLGGGGSGGGSDSPTEGASAAVRSADVVAGDVEPYEGTRTVRNRVRTLSFEVPDAWDAVDEVAWVRDRQEVGVAIEVAHDRRLFRETFSEPGVLVRVSANEARPSPEELLDEERLDDCTYDGREEYEAGAWSGQADRYSGCGGAAGTARVLAVHSTDDPDTWALVVSKAVAPRDEEAADQVMQTLERSGDLVTDDEEPVEESESEETEGG